MTESVVHLSAEQLRTALRDGDCWNSPDPDRWFPPEPGPGFPLQRHAYEMRAARLCAGCPVRIECLEYALRVESKPRQTPSGIWGGTAPWQRRQILATRHAARTSTERAAAVTRVQQVAYPERRAS